MDSEVKPRRSLPPLVEGKVQGHLKLTIDEIVWSRKGPGKVTVLASWWGEDDCALFRPADIKTNIVESSQEVTEVYAIKTNPLLFREYIKNCQTIQLVIYVEDSHEVIGTAQVGDLLSIFENNSYFKYVPILSNNGYRIGEIHVSIKLLNMTRDSWEQPRERKIQKKRAANRILSDLSANDKYYEKTLNEHESSSGEETPLFPVKLERLNGHDLKDTYRSVLKSKRKKFVEPVKKYDTNVTDKLVAQVVARAQRLRGAILKETDEEDPLALSDYSDGLHSDALTNENRLYDYFLGKEMSQLEEVKALNTLKSISPTQSFIEMASKPISSCKCNNMQVNSDLITSGENSVGIPRDLVSKESSYKEMSLLNRVDSIKIFVKSLTLTPAGYRRVRSSIDSRNESAQKPVSYFIQYDAPIDYYKPTNGKFMKNKKPVKVYSKKQVDQTIYFDYEAIHNISRITVNSDLAITFKILHRHLNQKLPSELGTGAVFIKDVAKTSNFCSTQRVAIIHKGIKTGDLKVTVELGCDCIHFGKQYIDAMMSTKENIPVLEVDSPTGSGSDRCRNVTGTQSKTNSRVSSASNKRIDCLSSGNNADFIAARNVVGQKQTSSDDNNVDIQNTEKENKNKILLHGLIYVAEGHDLPELNTYLICRAFWREDKAASKICTNTSNPVYNFCQLVPLIHGADLLERIKDNYIVIEVHSKNGSGEENLLGIAKLCVHQLYVAYRDPLVLPHLLLSQYPVISVDGWVPINDPITGQSRGNLLALVALGTAEQIARLEMSRGLRDNTLLTQPVPSYSRGGARGNFSRDTQRHGANENAGEREGFRRNDNESPNLPDTHASVKTQECQTDISTVQEVKNSETVEANRDDGSPAGNSVLHALVDRLAQALSIPRTNNSQGSQTETEPTESAGRNIESDVNVDAMTLHNVSDDSDMGSSRNHFEMPTEIYRSVGVGAEFDDTGNQAPNVDYGDPPCDSPIFVGDANERQLDSHQEETFRALVEIECALHLPRTGKANESVEPSTYVTFQTNSQGYKNHFDSYVTTNVFPNSCNPKWDWKCDTKLPTQLLLDHAKRLILKVWRLEEPSVSSRIDLEKDIVIGFSAIDLSVLLAGFPVVSGWFHIIDFTGKCNGQMKVSVTPLDNLAPFVKSSTTSVAQVPTYHSSRSTWSPSCSQDSFNDVETNALRSARGEEGNEEENPRRDSTLDIGQGFDHVSMSFLSVSLKQKLTELDEITKRLQSRLQDVTSTAFEEDFENDFELNEPNDNNVASNFPSEINAYDPSHGWQTSPTGDKYSPENTPVTNGNDNYPSTSHSYKPQVTSCNGRNDNYKSTPSIPPAQPTCPVSQNLSNGFHRFPSPGDNFSDGSSDYPVRGTKTHISYLLDKLTLQFPTKPMPGAASPLKRNVMDLLNDLRQNNNNPQQGKAGRESRSAASQTENEVPKCNRRDSCRLTTSVEPRKENNRDENRNANVEIPRTQGHGKISDVLREELIAEDNNDSPACDELSSYLMTSNVRHMDLDNIFNPLLYQHLVPRFPASVAASPEEEPVQSLDNRYSKDFGAAASNGRTGGAQRNPATSNERCAQQGNPEVVENAELFRLTPSGLSENVDGNIDLTVIHKPNDDDLMAANGTESTTTISFDKSSDNVDDDVSCSTSSESPVSTVSRQAPDGGNPAEEPSPPLAQNINDSQESSSSC